MDVVRTDVHSSSNQKGNDPMSKRKNDYFMNPEDAAEMARLILQDRLLTRVMGGLFPLPISPNAKVIDIACGPGGWALDVARAQLEEDPVCDGTVLGVDIDTQMISYAKAQAEGLELDNASFQVMDITEMPWPLDDNSFDIVNARLVGFFAPSFWPEIARELARITRSGGIVRLTETEMGISPAPALEQWHQWFFQAFHRAGHSFSPNGRRLAITSVLAPFLRRAGLRDVEIRAYALDWSYGSSEHREMYEHMAIGAKLIEPFFVSVGVATPEELEQVTAQMLNEIQQEGFAAVQYYLSAWGRKEGEQKS
jgi:ubiquinone/menaquinone biosynthesis C-methylase UbiE